MGTRLFQLFHGNQSALEGVDYRDAHPVNQRYQGKRYDAGDVYTEGGFEGGIEVEGRPQEGEVLLPQAPMP